MKKHIEEHHDGQEYNFTTKVTHIIKIASQDKFEKESWYVNVCPAWTPNLNGINLLYTESKMKLLENDLNVQDVL